MSQTEHSDRDETDSAGPPPAEEIAAELEGQRLDAEATQGGRCFRCRQKNSKRARLGVAERDREAVLDGEEVRFLVFGRASEWTVLDVIHGHHPQLPPEELAIARVTQAWGVANADVDDETGGFVVRNVSIETVLGADEGSRAPPAYDRIGARPWDRFVVYDEDDPHPLWPAETCEWLDELVDRVGGDVR